MSTRILRSATVPEEIELSEDENSTSSSNIEVEKEEFNNALIKIQQTLFLLYSPPCSQEDNSEEYETKRQNLTTKIEETMLNMLKDINEGKAPVITLRNTRNWDNCIFDEKLTLKPLEEATTSEIKFSEKRSRAKFALFMFVLGKIYKLLSTNSFCTKREMYYQNVDKISSQDILDHILNDVTSYFDVSLHDLNIYSTSKGLVYGPLEIFTASKKKIKCLNEGGTLIPNNVCTVKNLKSDAHFVLLIEKDAVFQKLIDDDIMRRLGPCILITGKGFPDINTRYLLKMLWNILAIPIFALVDPDPWGIDIMCVYRFGSLAMSHQSEQLAVPSLRWLGIHPSEIDKLYDKNEPLTDKDKAKLQDIINRPYIKNQPHLLKEIQILIDKNYKAEIEGIENQLTPKYLTKVYIKQKIQNSDCL